MINQKLFYLTANLSNRSSGAIFRRTGINLVYSDYQDEHSTLYSSCSTTKSFFYLYDRFDFRQKKNNRGRRHSAIRDTWMIQQWRRRGVRIIIDFLVRIIMCAYRNYFFFFHDGTRPIKRSPHDRLLQSYSGMKPISRLRKINFFLVILKYLFYNYRT